MRNLILRSTASLLFPQSSRMALTAYPPIMLHMQCFASKGNKKAKASSGRKQVEKEFVDEKGRELLSPVHEKWLVDMQRCSEDDFNYALVDEILKEEVEKLKEALSKLTIFKATPSKSLLLLFCCYVL